MGVGSERFATRTACVCDTFVTCTLCACWQRYGLPARSTTAIRNFTEKDFSSLALLGRFRAVLADVLDKGEVVTHRSFADSKRRLAMGDYLSLFLLGLFNPVARTVRGIVQASGQECSA